MYAAIFDQISQNNEGTYHTEKYNIYYNLYALAQYLSKPPVYLSPEIMLCVMQNNTIDCQLKIKDSTMKLMHISQLKIQALKEN